MKHLVKTLAKGSVAALAIMAAAPALATGTAAGTSITNTATVNYSVASVAQPAQNASDTFVVDRSINLVVAEDGGTTTQVVPGQTLAVTKFTLTNTGNSPMDYVLSATNLASGTLFGGTDNFDVTNYKIYRDVNGNGLYDAGTDTEVTTHIDELVPDTAIKLLVVADIPIGRATNDVAIVRLTAETHDGGTASTLGALTTQDTGPNVNGTVQNVFADAAGTGDAAKDGKHSADDSYTVITATLTVTKTSRIVSDPINGTTNPKMIPGATVEYCVTVANAAGGASATNVAVSDPLPSQVTYVANSVKVNGTVTGTTCNGDGTAGTPPSGNVVSGTIPTLAAGDKRTLLFSVTVN